MLIKIDHIDRLEGNAGLLSRVLCGDVASVRLKVRQASRQIEGVLIGEDHRDVPAVASRICGACSVSHTIACIKAIENAMKIDVAEEAIMLRKLMLWGHMIHSHSFHLYYLSLADYLDIENDLRLAREYPEETALIVRIREYASLLLNVIGGRSIHPVTCQVGGFEKVPNAEELRRLIALGESVLPAALKFGSFVKKLKMPDFCRPTEYVGLVKKGEYAGYDGDVESDKGLRVKAGQFEKNFHQFHRPKEIVNRVSADGRTSYMVGAIARVNLQRDRLGTQSRQYVEALGYGLPDHNPFHNVSYQMAEVIHAIESSVQALRQVAHCDLENALIGEYEVREGSAAAAIESPRGTMYYWMDIDGKGFVKNANVISPTAQSLTHLEDDIEDYIPQVVDLPAFERERKLRAFVRAYDPCIFCAAG